MSAVRHRAVRRVLIVTLLANIFVAVAKITIGALTRSLAMISDGIHSSLDATSNVIGLIGTSIASRPPDEDHPYGHRRFETLASMLIGGLLLLTAWEIIKGSILRLSEGTAPQVGPVNFAVMIGTLVINLLVSNYEHRAGRRLGSEFLIADAAHTRSDIFVSLTVIASLIAVWLGWGWMDAAAALVVVVLIGVAAWRIVRSAASILVDRAALAPEAIRDVVQRVPGVQEVGRVRSRGPEDDVYLDLDIQVAAPTTAAHSAAIAREIRTRLRQEFGGLKDIQVYFAPRQDAPPDYALIARAEADALGLSVHEVMPASGRSGLTLDLHVEVSPELSVGEAHTLVTRFEERLRAAIPGLERVVTHIEPAHTHNDLPLHSSGAHELAYQALSLAHRLYPEQNWHDLEIRVEGDGGYALSLHCHVPPGMPLEEAHRLAEEVETQIRSTLPAIHRVTIHTEPPEGPG